MPILLIKMPKRKCKFTDELKKRYSCFRNGRNEFEAECTVCNAGTYVSVTNKGSLDLEAHVGTSKHKQNVRGENSSSKISRFLVQPGSSVEVRAAEGTLAFHCVKHHNSYKSTDCTSALMKKIFPDSEIARKISSARTKTEAIVNSVIYPQAVDTVLECMASIPFVVWLPMQAIILQ